MITTIVNTLVVLWVVGLAFIIIRICNTRNRDD